MKRRQLEHIIRACAELADDNELIIIGSQSILGQFPDAPSELLRSMEADVFPKNLPERWELIDGSIGELSPFHETFGYYAQGVSETTATLPTGWRDRLIPINNHNTRHSTGWCLEVHDLLISKYAAGRPKDLAYAKIAAAAKLADRRTLLDRLGSTTIDASRRILIAQRIHADFSTG